MGRTTTGQQAAAAALADPAEPDGEGRLVVSPNGTVALLDDHGTDRVRFEGVAVGAGTFTDVAGRPPLRSARVEAGLVVRAWIDRQAPRLRHAWATLEGGPAPCGSSTGPARSSPWRS